MDSDNTLESPKGVYKIVEKLGNGVFGDVYLTNYTAKNSSNFKQVALKKIKIALHEMSEKNKEECKKETDLMEKTKSSTNQHIVKYLDSFMITETKSPSHEHLYIAMDYCSLGDLRSKIEANVNSRKQFDPKIIYDYIYQIADGINELHFEHNIVHRDLKPANILIALEGDKEVIKISDFGLAKMVDSLSKSLHTWCGTPRYMAPEQNSGHYQPSVDIWAIGIIFYELCIAPKELANEIDDIREKVKNGQRVNLPSRYSAADTTWLNRMIAKDQNKRMSSHQICDEAKDQNNRMQSNSEGGILFYVLYQNGDEDEGRIGLFNSFNCSVEKIEKFEKFDNYYKPYEVATTQNKIFGIDDESELFEIFDLDTREISRGPNPPEWRNYASVAYFKDKLYYLGGKDLKTNTNTNRVDVLIDGIWQIGPAFPLPIIWARTITCDGILYVVDGYTSKKIYRLSDDEQEWVEIEKIPEKRNSFGVASLNGKIYITGGENDDNDVLKSCLCFDPSVPVDNRISKIADMNYARMDHSLIVANGKLYAIGGSEENYIESFCNSIEEYDPQTKKWDVVGIVNI